MVYRKSGSKLIDRKKARWREPWLNIEDSIPRIASIRTGRAQSDWKTARMIPRAKTGCHPQIWTSSLLQESVLANSSLPVNLSLEVLFDASS